MHSLRRFPAFVMNVFFLCLAASPTFTSKSGHQFQSEVPDAFKNFCLFPLVAAVRDTNTNPIFKCLTATRVNFDSEAPSATYRWTLNIDGCEKERYPLLHFTPANTPDRVRTVVNSDKRRCRISRFLYSDYETCAVFETNVFGHQCTLWVIPELRDSVPDRCIKIHTELCGEGISLYDKHICGQQ